MNEMSEARTVDTITAEINALHQQAQQMAVAYFIQIGQRLGEVKKLIPYGGWTSYLKERTPYSQSTANNLMKLAREYGDGNLSLFGRPKSEAFGNLSYTQALALLALPEAEREEMAEKAPDMSTRELEKAIKERNEARAEAERMKSAAIEAEQIRQKLEKTQGSIEQLTMERDRAEERASTYERIAMEREKELQEAREIQVMEPDKQALAAAEEAGFQRAEEMIRAAEEDRDRAMSNRKKATDELEKAKESLKQAEEKKSKLEKQLREMESAASGQKKQLSKGAETFAALFGQTQGLVNQMAKVLREMDDRPTAEKLRKAMAALADEMRKAASDAG